MCQVQPLNSHNFSLCPSLPPSFSLSLPPSFPLPPLPPSIPPPSLPPSLPCSFQPLHSLSLRLLLSLLQPLPLPLPPLLLWAGRALHNTGGVRRRGAETRWGREGRREGGRGGRVHSTGKIMTHLHPFLSASLLSFLPPSSLALPPSVELMENNSKLHDKIRDLSLPTVDVFTVPEISGSAGPCGHTTMLLCHHVAIPPCGHTTMRLYHHVAIPPCGHTTMRLYHHVAIPSCGHTTMLPYRHVAISPCGHATMLLYHHVAIPPCGHTTMRPCHHVAIPLFSPSSCMYVFSKPWSQFVNLHAHVFF